MGRRAMNGGARAGDEEGRREKGGARRVSINLAGRAAERSVEAHLGEDEDELARHAEHLVNVRHVVVRVRLRQPAGATGAAVVSETGDTNGRTDGWGWRMAAA